MVITGLTRNQLGSNPPRVRISPSPPYKNQVHFCAPVFLYNARFEKGNAKHRNSPGDCFGARVRAAERRSEAGESRRLRLKMDEAKYLYCSNDNNKIFAFDLRRNSDFFA